MNKLLNNKIVRIGLPNVVLVGTCMLVTLLILDYYNPLMGFMTRDMSKVFLAGYVILLVLLVITVALRICLSKLSCKDRS